MVFNKIYDLILHKSQMFSTLFVLEHTLSSSNAAILNLYSGTGGVSHEALFFFQDKKKP